MLLYDSVEITPEHLKFLDAFDEQDLLSPDKQKKVIIELPPDNFEMKIAETEIIKKVLAMFNGNITKAASYLKMGRHTLRKKLGK